MNPQEVNSTLASAEAALRALLAHYDETSASKYVSIHRALAALPGTPEEAQAEEMAAYDRGDGNVARKWRAEKEARLRERAPVPSFAKQAVQENLRPWRGTETSLLWGRRWNTCAPGVATKEGMKVEKVEGGVRYTTANGRSAVCRGLLYALDECIEMTTLDSL